MTEQEDPLRIEMIRKVAETNLTITLDSKNRLLDENSAAARWILASLLTINGGVIFGIFSSDKVSNFGKLWAGGFCCAGIIFALFLAYATVLTVHKTIKQIMNIADFWMNAVIAGSIDGELLKTIQETLQKSVKPWTRASHAFGILSVACFLSGVIIIGKNLK